MASATAGMASAMARMAAAALRAHTTLPVPRAVGCGRAPFRAPPGCGRTPLGAPMLRRRFSLSFSWMIETLAPVPSHRWGLDLRRRRSIAWWPGVALAWVAGGGLEGALAPPGVRRPRPGGLPRSRRGGVGMDPSQGVGGGGGCGD